jgi:hypothetical protein
MNEILKAPLDFDRQLRSGVVKELHKEGVGSCLG